MSHSSIITRRSFTVLTTILALLFVAATTQAATVVWGPVTTITDEIDIVNAGGVIEARNYTSGALNIGVTVGTDVVTFVPTGAITGGAGPVFNAGAFDTGEAGQTVGANFDEVLDGFTFKNGGWTGETVDFTGLTGGDTYTVQVFLTDDRGGGVTTPTNMTIDGVTSGNLMTVNDGSDFVVGTVTLGAAETSISMALNNLSGNGVLNAVVLSQTPAVPEPSTLALAALGLLSLGLGRRRHRR